MMVSTTYFHAASIASGVLRNPTSSTEKSVVSSTAIQARFGSCISGTSSIENRNRLKLT